MSDSQSANLFGTSYTINSFDQPLALSSSHPKYDNSMFVCREKHPITSCDLLISHIDLNSDLECAPVKEDVHIKTSSSPHFPLFPTIPNASTCDEDNQFSFVSPSDDLSPRLTQDDEVFHDKSEKSLMA